MAHFSLVRGAGCHSVSNLDHAQAAPSAQQGSGTPGPQPGLLMQGLMKGFQRFVNHHAGSMLRNLAYASRLVGAAPAAGSEQAQGSAQAHGADGADAGLHDVMNGYGQQMRARLQEGSMALQSDLMRIAGQMQQVLHKQDQMQDTLLRQSQEIKGLRGDAGRLSRHMRGAARGAEQHGGEQRGDRGDDMRRADAPSPEQMMQAVFEQALANVHKQIEIEQEGRDSAVKLTGK